MKYLIKQMVALWINLRSGVRLALGRSLTPQNFVISIEQFFLLFLLCLLLELVTDYFNTQAPALFNPYGIKFLFGGYFIALLLMLLVARLAGAGLEAAGRFYFADLAVSPFMLLVALLVNQLISEETYHGPQLAFVFLFAWWVFIGFRILRIHLPLTKLKASLLATGNLLLWLASLLLLPNSSLWYSDPDIASLTEKISPLWQLKAEDVFYAQFPMMADAKEKLAAQRPGVTDLYLVTFAGYGQEKVFLNEVTYVQRLFDQKFDTQDRSMVLANNIESLEKYPLANRHNLADALAAIGQRMDLEEDILFLFMTSHGSKKHELSINLGPIEMQNLSPTELRQVLDKAGIRWRVILVSSCYSGGFIPELADPKTLVMTAAAKDRTSFGCGSKSEFTTFGDAYFRQALQQQTDFIEAFQAAVRIVNAEETEQKRKASNPQISIGSEIRPRLLQLYRDLAGAKEAEPVAQAGIQ